MRKQIVHSSKGGFETWKLNGEYHREDGPALVGPHTQEWYRHGKCHREDGPASINTDTGVTRYFQKGFLHREDGPAVIGPNGQKEYWLEGRPYKNMVEYHRVVGDLLQLQPAADVYNLTDQLFARRQRP